VEIIPTEFMYLYVTLLAFAFGACVGSFLNVCIYRIPAEESVVTPRSHCPKCGHMIAWYDNIPMLSWVLLRAKCRGCKAKISPRYFLVELLTAVLFLLLWMQYGLDLRVPVYWLAVAGLILGTFVDIDHMILPDRVTKGGMIVGPILSMLVPALHGEVTLLGGLIASLKGLVLGFGALWLVARVGRMAFKQDAMGFGDVKLMGAIGALLGWQAVLFTILVSSLLGSVVGLALVFIGGREWQSRIPYGPYIAAAAVLWMLWGHSWWAIYWQWLQRPIA
jgi:leader peptidase (prepilin peptidase)/N-methyltransferase